jgi:ubiquitin-protein ligase E3 C
VNDLVFLDPDLHKNLRKLRTMSSVEDLGLTFSVLEEGLGKRELVELIPGGKDIPVTNENKFKFIARMADYKLNISIKKQSNAFLYGLSQIISPELLRMFNQEELQTLISGKPGGIDLVDLRKYCNYSGGYHDGHPVIQNFWKVLASFTPEEQRAFLMFVTSCSRVI